MRDDFWEGFEKEAKLKAALLAGAMALSPAVAKAGGNQNAVNMAAKAINKQWGQQIMKKAPKAVKSVQNKVSKGIDAGAGKLSLKDLSRVQYKKGNFQASLGGGGDVTAKYNLGKGLDVVGKKGGGDTYAGLSYKKEF